MEARLQKREGKLDAIVETMKVIAKQDNRLKQLEKNEAALWNKWDDYIVPHITQCPKEQVKRLWFIVVPMGVVLLGLGVKLCVG